MRGLDSGYIVTAVETKGFAENGEGEEGVKDNFMYFWPEQLEGWHWLVGVQDLSGEHIHYAYITRCPCRDVRYGAEFTNFGLREIHTWGLWKAVSKVLPVSCNPLCIRVGLWDQQNLVI